MKESVSKTKPAFYEWYKRQIDTYTVEGKRYFGLMVLAIIGRKCGIPREQVEQDALGFVSQLDELTTKEDNHFREDDALKAVTAYDVAHFAFMRRETLVRLSGVPITENKRNHRTQAQHMKIMSAVRDIDYPNGEWRNVFGRPNKMNLVINYKLDNPKASIRDIAKALSISPTTVNKWLKELKDNPKSQEILNLLAERERRKYKK